LSRFTILEGGVAGVFVLCIWYSIFRISHVDAVSHSFVATVAPLTPPAIRGAVFGDKFALDGAAMQTTTNGVQLDLVWRSLARESLDFSVAIHLVDGEGTI